MYLLDAFQQLFTGVLAEKQTQHPPHTDTGDFMIVINAEKVKLTGKKQLIRSTTSSNRRVDWNQSLLVNFVLKMQYVWSEIS